MVHGTRSRSCIIASYYMHTNHGKTKAYRTVIGPTGILSGLMVLYRFKKNATCSLVGCLGISHKRQEHDSRALNSCRSRNRFSHHLLAESTKDKHDDKMMEVMAA